jgi:hypothetical protein
MRHFYFAFPIGVLLLGALVHVAAVLGFKMDTDPGWTDWLFLAIDSLLALALFARARWGYWVALLLFCQQVATQGYWAVRVGFATRSVFGLQQAAAALCVGALLLMATQRALFRKDSPTARSE